MAKLGERVNEEMLLVWSRKHESEKKSLEDGYSEIGRGFNFLMSVPLDCLKIWIVKGNGWKKITLELEVGKRSL